MSEIKVTREQAQAIAAAPEGMSIVDPDGNLVGYTESTFSAAELAEAEAALASDEPRYTTQEVLAYLTTLEQTI